MALKRTAGSLLENIMGGVSKPVKSPAAGSSGVVRKLSADKPKPVVKPKEKEHPVGKANSSLPFIHTREKRDGVLYLRVSALTRERLDYLCKESHSSQATVIESLIEAAVEGKVSG